MFKRQTPVTHTNPVARLAKLNESQLYEQLAASVISSELAEAKKIDETLEVETRQLETLSKKINQQLPRDAYKELKAMVTENVDKQAADAARKEIGKVLGSFSLLGSKQFSKYVTAAEFEDISYAWPDLQKYYIELINDFASQQLVEASVSPEKNKNIRKLYGNLLMTAVNHIILKNNSRVSPPRYDAAVINEDIAELNNGIILQLFVDASTLGEKEYNDNKRDFSALTQRLVKEKKLPEADAKQIHGLVALLNTPKIQYSMLRQQLIKFRVALEKENTGPDSLYVYLPDVESVKPFSELPKGSDRTQVEKEYEVYDGQLAQIDKAKKSDVRAKDTLSELVSMLDMAVNNKLATDQPNQLGDMLASLKVLEKNDIAEILEVISLLNENNRVKKTEAIAKSSSFISGLNEIILKYQQANQRNLREELKQYINEHRATADKPDELANKLSTRFVLADENKLEKIAANTQKLQHDKVLMNDVAATKIDIVLLDQLRASAMHAAKLYLQDRKKGGFLQEMAHKSHHGGKKEEAEEKKAVVSFIQKLHATDNMSFTQAAALTRDFLLNLPGGLHTNSFDTIFLKLLYNEGNPKGLFQGVAANTGSYQAYPPDEKACSDDVAMTKYIKEKFNTTAEATMQGVVVDKLVGKDKKADRPVILHQELEILVALSQLAGKHGHVKFNPPDVASKTVSLNSSDSSGSRSPGLRRGSDGEK